MLETLAGPVADGTGLDAAIARAVGLHPALAELVAPLFATTIAPTRLRGSEALNVMPARASVDCDCRLVPGATEATLRAELDAALGDDVPYKVEFPDAVSGGTASPVDTPLMDACRTASPPSIPARCCADDLNGFTDSHYVREAFGAVAYGIWPVRTTPTRSRPPACTAPTSGSTWTTSGSRRASTSSCAGRCWATAA